MSECGPKKEPDTASKDPCAPPPSPCCSAAAAGGNANCPLTHFANMIPNCLAYAQGMKAQGHPIAGIMCEYTPRELIMAAGAVPVCLCGGSADTIPGAEEDLPSNLCPLIKSTYGYHVRGSNPFLEMADLIIAETTCDGKKKMYELMAESRPMYVLELPQKQDEPVAFAHWETELRRCKGVLEAAFDTTITDAALHEAIAAMNRERGLRRRLAQLMQLDCPPLTGRQLLNLKSSISCIPADIEQYEKTLTMLEGGKGPAERAEKVRVLMTGVPMAHGAERVLDIIEDNGGLVVALESCVGIKPIEEDVEEGAEDPLCALAQKYFHLPCSVMTANDRRMTLLRRLGREYRAQCVIELVWQACITYDVEAYRVKKLAENELGLPYLRIETDYSPSDNARLAVRVEALFETARAATARAQAAS